MTHVLKPCPFCGAKADDDFLDGGKPHWVFCNKCRAEGPTADTPTQAAMIWNTRAIIPVLGADPTTVQAGNGEDVGANSGSICRDGSHP